MKTPTFAAIKAVLRNEDQSTKHLKLAPLVKALGGETDQDVAFVEMYANSLVSENRLALSEKGEYYIPVGTKKMFKVVRNEESETLEFSEKIVTKEEAEDALGNGFQTSIGGAAREYKRALRTTYEKQVEELEELTKSKKD